MEREDINRCLFEALEKKVPDKTKLVKILMKTLFMEKGAVYRRLREEVPFSFFEVVKIAKKLDIALNSLVCSDSVKVDHFVLNIVEYSKMSEVDYKEWENYISLLSLAKDDSNSEIAESSNVLPISIYAKFDSLSRYFLFKYQYMFSTTEKRIPYSNLAISDRLYRIYHSYFDITKNFAKTVYIWDFYIFRYLLADIHFFSGINLISVDDIRQIKEDLFALLDYIEDITLNGCFKETGNSVSFYISDINLDADYSYLQFNDMNISHVRTFMLNSVVSSDDTSFIKIKDWIQSLKKTSTLITRSGAVFRTDFFDSQRKIIDKL